MFYHKLNHFSKKLLLWCFFKSLIYFSSQLMKIEYYTRMFMLLYICFLFFFLSSCTTANSIRTINRIMYFCRTEKNVNNSEFLRLTWLQYILVVLVVVSAHCWIAFWCRCQTSHIYTHAHINLYVYKNLYTYIRWGARNILFIAIEFVWIGQRWLIGVMIPFTFIHVQFLSYR